MASTYVAGGNVSQGRVELPLEFRLDVCGGREGGISPRRRGAVALA